MTIQGVNLIFHRLGVPDLQCSTARFIQHYVQRAEALRLGAICDISNLP